MLIGIIGGGAWGSTLAQLLVDNGHRVIIYDINIKNVEKINNRQHPFFNVELPSSIEATTNLSAVTSKVTYLILAIPTRVMRPVLQQINALLTKKTYFIDVSKGLEPESGKRISQLVEEEIDPKYLAGYAVLTGPSHAEEVIKRKITLLTAASENEKLSKTIQEIFSNNTYMRVYTSFDVTGSEVGGAAKNAIAVVSGISTGYGMGENARAALITRGILEIARIVEYYGGNKETVFGLTGIGDLIVTASSEHSRNFRAGKRIGEGLSIDEIYAQEPQTIEGFRSIKALYHLAKKEGIYLPIICYAYEVIFNKMSISEALTNILSSELKEEKIE
ncbi:MAG: NAD(P)-dependent glycerol-3-phosphate dehydrogenase [Acholeplasmataceae bacterium]|jgi:glycerol-3-phosphate dehydrogenase (NAD(P)+)|nr:NAD(P)-dependent glycerol-3-phosphate dehydrogenase [Acholeplasmataceae bacterium]